MKHRDFAQNLAEFVAQTLASLIRIHPGKSVIKSISLGLRFSAEHSGGLIL